MIDQMDASQLATWKTNLQPGDIVAFRFPHQTGGPEDPKVRPALVLDIVQNTDLLFAVLAYGTSNPRARREAYTVDVRIEQELAVASLRKPTRFHASRRISVSLSNSCFDVNPALKTAVLGRLTGGALERLHVVRARIRAERDMRQSRLFGRRGRGRAPGAVTVEYRTNGLHGRKELRNV